MGVVLTNADYVSRSRGVLAPAYFIMTPYNMLPYALPFFEKTIVYVLATPRVGLARFGQYLLDMDPGALTSRAIKPGFENFFYQLEGEAILETEGKTHTMSKGGYAYLPDTMPFTLKNDHSNHCRLLWTKRRYEAVEGLPASAPIFGHRNDIEWEEIPVAGILRQVLIPLSDPSYDFAMNIGSFDPGVYFEHVEIHHQEHGLYMTEGQGVYYLAGDFHEVKKDDFIYMAPYCPQYFYATGWTKSEYIIYKDTNRDGF